MLLMKWRIRPLGDDEVWPDFSKFRHFGNIFKVCGILFDGLFSIGQNIETFLAHFCN